MKDGCLTGDDLERARARLMTNLENVVPVFGFDPDDISEEAPPADVELIIADVKRSIAGV